jgi:hypothetical protein
MTLKVRRHQSSELAFPDQGELKGLLGMSGELVILSFRGSKIRALAEQYPEGQRARPGSRMPVTDLFQLELLTGTGEAPHWPRPVSLNAIVEGRPDPVLAVQHASRWASYCARVAVAPKAALNDQALLEARLRGVWLIAASEPRRFEVAVTGESAPVAGSARGLAHRLLDELIWQELSVRQRAPGGR